MPDDIFSRLNWQNEDSTATRTLPESIKHWLFWQDSLTQKLKQYCTEFEVKVRSEKWLNKMAKNETELLSNGLYRSREVTLLGDGLPWIEAKTLIEGMIRMYRRIDELEKK